MSTGRAPDPTDLILHATTVATDGVCVAITGQPGSGKSSLGLALMAMGCGLVADDRTVLRREGDAVVASCPESIAGLIEARGIGILKAEPVARARLALVVDLDLDPPDRLPPVKDIELLGVMVPVIAPTRNDAFAAAVLQLLKYGRDR